MAEEKKNRRYSVCFIAEPYTCTFAINLNKFRTAYKLLRIEKVDFFFLIFTRILISEAS